MSTEFSDRLFQGMHPPHVSWPHGNDKNNVSPQVINGISYSVLLIIWIYHFVAFVSWAAYTLCHILHCKVSVRLHSGCCGCATFTDTVERPLAIAGMAVKLLEQTYPTLEIQLAIPVLHSLGDLFLRAIDNSWLEVQNFEALWKRTGRLETFCRGFLSQVWCVWVRIWIRLWQICREFSCESGQIWWNLAQMRFYIR